MESSKEHGGLRAGAGRKKRTSEQVMADKAARTEALIEILLDELIFPAVCTAWHSDPGRWNERILTFELSASQIREAYGHMGLAEWKSYFTAVKRGGIDRFGNGYQTLWRFNNAKYGFILRLVKALGHDIKELPNPGFPPVAMLKRLEAYKLKQATRAANKRT